MTLTYTGIHIKELPITDHINLEPVDIFGDLDLTDWLADLEQEAQFNPCRTEFAMRKTVDYGDIGSSMISI